LKPYYIALASTGHASIPFLIRAGIERPLPSTLSRQFFATNCSLDSKSFLSLYIRPTRREGRGFLAPAWKDLVEAG